MSRRPQKLNFALLQLPPTTLNIQAWQKIQDAYGRLIPESARAEIIEATNKFLHFSAFAHAALSLPEALKRVDALERCAVDLLATVCNRSDPSVEAVEVVDVIIDRYLRTWSTRRHESAKVADAPSLAVVADVAGCLKAACAKTKQELEERASNGLNPDAHWNLWVRRIRDIAQKHKLPFRVRKDRRKYPPSGDSRWGWETKWEPSPFVRLVKALQNYLPSDQYRKKMSDDALSHAINSARAENWL